MSGSTYLLCVVGAAFLALAVYYWPERKPPMPPDFGGGVWDEREQSDEDEQC